MALFADYLITSLSDATFVDYLTGDAANGLINLSNATVTSTTAGIGSSVGSLSVTGGSTRAYTFSLTNNPGGLFSIGGSTLSVAAALSAGLDPITIRATDTGVSVLSRGFVITVLSTINSFVPTFELFGF